MHADHTVAGTDFQALEVACISRQTFDSCQFAGTAYGALEKLFLPEAYLGI